MKETVAAVLVFVAGSLAGRYIGDAAASKFDAADVQIAASEQRQREFTCEALIRARVAETCSFQEMK